MVQDLEILKHDFKITVDPKSPPIGPNFWLDFDAPDRRSLEIEASDQRGCLVHFLAKTGSQIKIGK